MPRFKIELTPEYSRGLEHKYHRSNYAIITNLRSATREVSHNNPFRGARTLYDQLAKVASLELMDTLHLKGWREKPDHSNNHTHYWLTRMAEQGFAVRGVDLSLVHGLNRVYAPTIVPTVRSGWDSPSFATR